MDKKVVVLYEQDKPVKVLELKTFTDSKTLDAFKIVCKENFAEIEKQKLAKAEEKEKEQKKITDTILHDVTLLNLEVKLLRGLISEEDYEKEKEYLCNGMK